MSISKEFRDKKKDIKEMLKAKYGLTISNRWLDKYIFYYSHCINQLKPIYMVEAIDDIHANIERFAFFIYGMNVNHKRKNDD